MSRTSSSGWLLALVLSLLFSLVIGLSLVWLSIERTDTAYSIRQIRSETERKIALRNKLEVERDKLLAPYELGRKAAAFGMKEARPGQIRKLARPRPEGE